MTTSFKENSVFHVERNFMKDLMPSGNPGIALENAENSKTDFLGILGSKYINVILSRTSVKECSASELSNELNIPLATVYRKLKLLEESGLVENVKTIINISGNEEKFYRCLISEATVNFHNGKLSVKVEIMGHVNKITRLWKRFTKSPDIAEKGESINYENR
jgi:predicted transcriptional regulator